MDKYEWKSILPRIESIRSTDKLIVSELVQWNKGIYLTRVKILFLNFAFWIYYLVYAKRDTVNEPENFIFWGSLFVMSTFLTLRIFKKNSVNLKASFSHRLSEIKKDACLGVFLIYNSYLLTLITASSLIYFNPVFYFFEEVSKINAAISSFGVMIWLPSLINLITIRRPMTKTELLKKDKLGFSKCFYYFLGENKKDFVESLFEKIFCYNIQEEIEKALDSEIKSIYFNIIGLTPFQTLLLAGKTEIVNKVINSEKLKSVLSFDFSKTLNLMGTLYLNKEIDIDDENIVVKNYIAKAMCFNEAISGFTFWELALMSQDVDLVSGLYIPEQERDKGSSDFFIYSKIQSPKLLQWFNEQNIPLQREKFNFLGGLKNNYIFIGSDSIPILDEINKEKIEWSDLNLNNKNLEKVFLEKIFVDENDFDGGKSYANQHYRNFINEGLILVSADLINLLLELGVYNYGFDLNLIANHIKKTNFFKVSTSLRRNIFKKENNYYDLDNEKYMSIFGVVLSKLYGNFSKDKVLKIIFNSLNQDFVEWASLADLWIQVERDHELFGVLSLPKAKRVNNILDLNIFFKNIIKTGQNPKLPLNQGYFKQKLENKKYKRWDIKIPMINKDLVDAGNEFSICLGNGIYFKRVNTGISNILFLMDKGRLDYIVEVDKSGFVIQARTRFNVEMDKVEQWNISQFIKGCFK